MIYKGESGAQKFQVVMGRERPRLEDSFASALADTLLQLQVGVAEGDRVTTRMKLSIFYSRL